MNATVNPFLYSLLSKRFRRGFQDLKKALLCQKTPNSSLVIVAGGNGVAEGCSSSKIQIPLRELKKTASSDVIIARNTTIPQCPASKITIYVGNRCLSEPQKLNDSAT